VSLNLKGESEVRVQLIEPSSEKRPDMPEKSTDFFAKIKILKSFDISIVCNRREPGRKLHGQRSWSAAAWLFLIIYSFVNRDRGRLPLALAGAVGIIGQASL